MLVEENVGGEEGLRKRMFKENIGKRRRLQEKRL